MMMNIASTQTKEHTVKDASSLFHKLQKAEKKQAALYLFCNFISLLLITAYAAMMYSPTILLVLPEGGDSRKQMVAIFVLALFGCVVFTIYASCLFFRKKSKQLGTLMALGASRRWLAPGLFKGVVFLSSFSSLLGIIAGFPTVWLIWSAFRLFVVDSQEMKLIFDFRCLLLSAVFFLLVVGFSCVTAFRYLKRTNIMDVVHEEHKNEPVKQLGKWCGPVGIILVFAGGIAGYMAPGVYQMLFAGHYAPAWVNIFFAPVFVGLYLIMLHTVVHGWISYKKHPYKNIISRGMMKFQGRQTVNNLLVSTVLIAGAAFALFYTPMMSIGQMIGLNDRPFGYAYRHPQTEDMFDREEINALAADYHLTTTDYMEISCLVLGTDGLMEVEDSANTYHEEYRELLMEGRFLSESNFSALSQTTLSVEPGTYYMITNDDETGTYYGNTGATLLTNMATGNTLSVTFGGFAHYGLITGITSFYVINDEDYASIEAGITPDWVENMVFFNMDGEDSYAFASKLYRTLIDRFDPKYAVSSYYDRVTKAYYKEIGEVYTGESIGQMDFDSPDSNEFRTYWLYMPKFTILDKTDFVRTNAVYMMMFLFICIICLLAAIVISYTRCMTIALNNRYVFDDLKKLGASPTFLMNEVRAQSGKVFAIPSGVGMSIMFLLYTLLMYGNDGKLTSSEIISLSACLLLLFVIAGVFYLIYRKTIKSMAAQLGIISEKNTSHTN